MFDGDRTRRHPANRDCSLSTKKRRRETSKRATGECLDDVAQSKKQRINANNDDNNDDNV